ncbi:MAG: BMP family ABC transporter substrate-binding protein [Eubacteriales bacterium]|nr:BMP family ABC transporter substrate-binding protein [Eubacteriales bacterium]
MKRYIALTVAVCMMLSMVGCSKAKDLFPENTKVEGQEQTGPVDESRMKVGFLFPSGSDSTDTMARVEGIRRMQYETGLSDNQIIMKTGVKKADVETTIDNMVAQGCHIIFSCGKSWESSVIDAAGKYPNVQFCQEGGKKAKKSGLSNMHDYYVRLYEGYYVSGIAAGMKINEMLNHGKISRYNCKIGFVANKKEPESTSCANAFYLGVGEACSQASMLVRYTDSTGVYDDDGEAARQLAKAGVGFMSQYTTTTAVAAVCAENDIPIVGNEQNIIDVAPNEALTSAVVNWDAYYSYAIDCLIEGEEIDADWSGGYKEGAVTLTQLNDAHLAQGTVERLKTVEEALRKKSEKVFDTEKFTVEGESLSELVEEDENYKKYKKYVYDGAFHESEKRSAPAMDFMMDGVEESTYDYLLEESEEE